MTNEKFKAMFENHNWRERNVDLQF